MEKVHPSSKRNYPRLLLLLVEICCIGSLPEIFGGITLSHADALRIGKKVWQNECNGTVAGLTSWNKGEQFASLGIGHFIWYPHGIEGPFEESFPKLVNFMSVHGAQLPTMLQHGAEADCPWNSRAEFLRAQDTSEMEQLRQFLANSVDLQAEFLVARLQAALPKILAEASPSVRAKVQGNFEQMASTARGLYALVDYVNFKGEGVLHTERYQNHGWGLFQVLDEMRSGQPDPVDEFSRAAAMVLRRRVTNSPPARHEIQWLPGWLNRVKSYTRN